MPETAACDEACDNNTVGVLITDGSGRYLAFDRATEPVGVAFPCGHALPGEDWLVAACREVSEEVGLIVEQATVHAVRWLRNRCRRAPGPLGVGHNWTVYRAVSHTGEVVINPAEVSNPRWLTVGQLQLLADRTVAYAHGRLSEQAWRERPGLEPAWVAVLGTTQIAGDPLLAVAPADLEAVLRVAAGCEHAPV